MSRHIGFTSITRHILHFFLLCIAMNINILPSAVPWQWTARGNTLYHITCMVFSTFDILYREYRIAHDE